MRSLYRKALAGIGELIDFNRQEPPAVYDRDAVAQALGVRKDQLPEKGQDPTEGHRSNYHFSLQYAACTGDVHGLKYCKLLHEEFGERILNDDTTFWKAMRGAINEKEYGALKYLASFVPKEKMRPERKAHILGYAAYKGDKKAMRILLDAGIDPNVPNGPYGSVLANLAEHHPDLLRFLLDRGADINLIDPHDHQSVLSSVLNCSSLTSEKQEIVELLLDYGANPNLEGEEVTALMHGCARHGYLDRTNIVERLLAKTVNINALSRDGRNVFLYLLGNHSRPWKWEGWLDKLRESGVDIHAVDANGNNAVHLAAALENTSHTWKFWRWGIDLEHRNHKGETPLVKAIKAQNWDMTHALLDLHVRDLSGALLTLLETVHSKKGGTKKGDNRKAMELASRLLDAGTDIHAPDGKKALLHHAKEVLRDDDLEPWDIARLICTWEDTVRDRYLLDDDDKPLQLETRSFLSKDRAMLRQLLGADLLAEAFEPHYWQDRPDEARKALARVLGELPEEEARRYSECIDQTWMRPDPLPAGSFVTRTHASPLGNGKAR